MLNNQKTQTRDHQTPDRDSYMERSFTDFLHQLFIKENSMPFQLGPMYNQTPVPSSYPFTGLPRPGTDHTEDSAHHNLKLIAKWRVSSVSGEVFGIKTAVSFINCPSSSMNGKASKWHCMMEKYPRWAAPLIPSYFYSGQTGCFTSSQP